MQGLIDGGFNIKFTVGNMSNGETVGYPVIFLSHEGKNEYFGIGKAGSFEQGLTKIKTLFSI